MLRKLLVLLGLGIQVWAQAGPVLTTEQTKLLALENSWNQAFQQKDRAAIDMLLGADLVYIEYDGKLMNKSEYLATVQSPTLHPTKVVSESMNVTLYGAAAVIHGVYRENGEKNGKPYSIRERFIDTWVKRDRQWVCVASQATLIMP